MKLEVNKVYSGFIVKHAEYVEEVQSEAYLMEHEKSGGRLLYLGNSDDNKVFSISFRTPPYDDTGVPHILEHSSLCGSRKYHLKEPFVELVKGSMNTFLNAMTYPDKTMYPVARQNFDEVHTYLTGYVCQNNMAVFQFYLEHGIWQRFQDCAFNLNYILFGHAQYLLAQLPERLSLTSAYTLSIGCMPSIS